MLAALPLLGGSPAPEGLLPNLQEMQLAGRVLHFQAPQPSGTITMAIVYNRADPQSLEEAAALQALLGDGLEVDELVLKPMLVEQSQLAGPASYGVIFSTAGVDPALLGAALRQRRIPCLTRHVEQVRSGSCTVAIRSAPSVDIVLNAANASASGVHFATAFRMMVEEL